MYTCPVCGYDKLDEPPDNHYICPQCGVQFGYDDATLTHAELREMWITGGRDKIDTAGEGPIAEMTSCWPFDAERDLPSAHKSISDYQKQLAAKRRRKKR